MLKVHRPDSDQIIVTEGNKVWTLGHDGYAVVTRDGIRRFGGHRNLDPFYMVMATHGGLAEVEQVGSGE